MMFETKNLPDAIQWHEGMLLAPQHFQQMSLRNETLLQYHMTTAIAYHWGIKRFQLDHARLLDGFFRIVELEAVMPDGMIINHCAQDEELEIDLAPFDREIKIRPLTICVAVAAVKPGSAIVKGNLPRYTSIEGQPVVDENSGESELSIPRLKPKIHLLVMDTPAQKYTAFPLAKVGYQNETIRLTRYLPPILAVTESSPVGKICGKICRRLREKALFVAEKVGGTGVMSTGPMVLETKNIIQCLVSELPKLEAMLNSGISHPYSLYLCLCSVMGNLAILGHGMMPPTLEAYDHHNLLESFDTIAEFILRVIDEGVQESHTPMLFNASNGRFTLNMEAEWLTGNIIIGVRGKPETNSSDVIDWIEESMIGSESVVESMKAKRILGADRKKIETSGTLIPARGVTLFAVSADPKLILADQKLAIMNSSDPKGDRCPLEIVLYVANREKS